MSFTSLSAAHQSLTERLPAAAQDCPRSRSHEPVCRVLSEKLYKGGRPICPCMKTFKKETFLICLQRATSNRGFRGGFLAARSAHRWLQQIRLFPLRS